MKVGTDNPNKNEGTNHVSFDKENMDEIYDYYQKNLIPAIFSSLPILYQKLKQDSGSIFYNTLQKIVHCLIPWTRKDFQWHAPHVASEAYGNFTQFLMNQFDSDKDGVISASELLQGNFEKLHVAAKPPLQFNSPFIARLTSWPLVDWKLATLLWRSCGGLLLIIVAASIIPGRLHGLSGRILRWPVLFVTYLTIFSELIVYIMVRLFIRLAESVFATGKHRALRKSLKKAASYEEWLGVAKKLDYSQGRDIWQNNISDETSYRYNWAFINELIMDLRQARRANDVMLAFVVLQQCTRKNVGGIMNEDLFSYTNTGEPKLIVKEFLEEVVKTLKWLTKRSRIKKPQVKDVTDAEHTTQVVTAEYKNKKSNKKAEKNKNIVDMVMDTPLVNQVVGPVQWAIQVASGNGKSEDRQQQSNAEQEPMPNIDHEADEEAMLLKQQREQVKTFLKRARAAYGRTALCLSGGAMMGLYHFGHVTALFEAKILPHIISGTSAGSVIAATVCTRTDEEIRRDMRPEVLADKLTCFARSWPDRFRFMRKHGCLFDQNDWLELIQWFTCGQMTFEEAYRKTGRILCITLSSTTKKAPPVLVNYITAPNVTIASAVIASAAVPGFIKPVILRKKGPDGIVREQAENKDEAYWDGSIDQDIPTSGLAEMFNCQFFLSAQCNPHVVPFFHSSKGDVAQPSRWSMGPNEDGWRGGFLLAALERYLKNDMKSKFHFLNDLEVAVGFTSTMMTQEFHGSTTIVPHVSFTDYFKLFSDPTLPFLEKCFQVGKVAAYKHCALMKLHYSIANSFDECLAMLEDDDGSAVKTRRRIAQLARAQYFQDLSKLESRQPTIRGRGFSINAGTPFASEINVNLHASKSSDHSDDMTSSSSHDDEYELSGFDGVHTNYVPPDKRRYSDDM